VNYQEKLLDPRWQKKRLEVFQRAGFKCESCGRTDRTLHVHHLIYSKGEPWEAPDHTLESLCDKCHEWRTRFDEVAGQRSLVSTFFCWHFSDQSWTQLRDSEIARMGWERRKAGQKEVAEAIWATIFPRKAEARSAVNGGAAARESGGTSED
jgi:hypothetical protein